MNKLVLELHEGVVAVIEKLWDISESEIEIEVPEGSVLFENSLNLKLIKKEAEKLGKSISFNTSDEYGLVILDLIDGAAEGGSSPNLEGSDFISKEVKIGQVRGKKSSKERGKKFSLPFNFNLPSFSFLKNIRLPKISLPRASGIGFIVGAIIVVGLLSFGIYRVYWVLPKAEIKIVVNSQPLIKSLELEVVAGEKTNADNRVLEGRGFTAVVTQSEKTQTTGTKIVGDRAEGKIKIYNNKTEEVSFDDGEELQSEDDNDLIYRLKEDVTVPAATVSAPDPLNNMATTKTPGVAEVSVIAEAIGKKYNLDKGEDLEFDDYTTSDYFAEVSSDIDGGNSDTLSIVAQADLDALNILVSEKINEEGPDSLKGNLAKGWILIEGSETSTTTSTEYSASVGDEEGEVELTKSMSFQGLAYERDSLDKLLDSLLQEFVPSGFELSSEDRDINVEILGNSDVSILTSTAADLQVTLKSFVIPKVNEDKLLNELTGAKFSDAEKTLNNIRNVKTYEISMSPNIPLLNRLPKNQENITLMVEKD